MFPNRFTLANVDFPDLAVLNVFSDVVDPKMEMENPNAKFPKIRLPAVAK